MEIADVRESITAPTAPRSAGIATRRVIRIGRRSFGIVKVYGPASGRNLEFFERLRNVDAPAEGDHKLVVAALHRPEIRYLGILVVGSPKRDLEPGVRLEQPVEAVAIP